MLLPPDLHIWDHRHEPPYPASAELGTEPSVCACECRYLCRQKKMSSPLKLKSQTIVSCLKWVLRTELWPLEKQRNCNFRFFFSVSEMLSDLSSPRISTIHLSFKNSSTNQVWWFIGHTYNLSTWRLRQEDWGPVPNQNTNTSIKESPKNRQMKQMYQILDKWFI